MKYLSIIIVFTFIFSCVKESNNPKSILNKQLKSLQTEQQRQIINSDIDVYQKISIANLLSKQTELGTYVSYVQGDFNNDSIQDFSVEIKAAEIEYYDPKQPEYGGIFKSFIYWFSGKKDKTYSSPVILADDIELTDCKSELIFENEILSYICKLNSDKDEKEHLLCFFWDNKTNKLITKDCAAKKKSISTTYEKNE